MALYRTIRLTFWTDTKVAEDFTPEDKYFYIYLMTNPQTNLAGCYELSMKIASDQTGYSRETISRLLDRMEHTHGVIKYSSETREVLIMNWSKYNWTKSADFQKPLVKQIESVKNADFKTFLEQELDGIGTVLGRSYDRPETSVTVTNNNNISVSDKDISKSIDKSIEDIVYYLNKSTGKSYKTTSVATKRHIKARLKEGFTVDDFKKVIDTKVAEWGNDQKMCQYLRPETLFGTKFESYLNQGGSSIDRWAEGSE